MIRRGIDPKASSRISFKKDSKSRLDGQIFYAIGLSRQLPRFLLFPSERVAPKEKEGETRYLFLVNLSQGNFFHCSNLTLKSAGQGCYKYVEYASEH